MITTQTHVQTVTTSKLLVATMVALFAGGLAFMAGTMGDTGSLGSPSTSGSNWVCKDSDGGFTLDTQGLLTVQNPATGDYSRSYFDSCADSKTVREWYCPTNSTLSYAVTSTPCSNGTVCSSGACVDPAKPPTTTVAMPTFSCFDTDGGKIANKQGTISVVNATTSTNLTDSCNSRFEVNEMFCDPKSKLGYSNSRLQCALGTICDSGACVPSNCTNDPTNRVCQIQCSDTENGGDPTIPGTLTLQFTSSSQPVTYWDSCYGSNKLEEVSCIPPSDRTPSTTSGLSSAVKTTQYDCAQQGQKCWNKSDGNINIGYCGPKPAVASVGTTKVLVMVVDDWILGSDPHADLAAVRNKISSTTKQLSQIYSDMSYGKLNLVFDVCEIKNSGLPFIAGEEANETAVSLCAQQVNIKDYGIVTTFGGWYNNVQNVEIAGDFMTSTNQGNLAFCSFSPVEFFSNGTLDMSTLFDTGVAAHEIGHCLGLGHAKGYDCGFNPYGPKCNELENGDEYDYMGRGAASFGISPTVFPHLNCIYKQKLGWINDSPITAPGTYAIASLEATSTPLPQCLSLPVDNSLLFSGIIAPGRPSTMGCDKLYLEYRTPRRDPFGHDALGGLSLHCARFGYANDPLSIVSDMIDCEPNTPNARSGSVYIGNESDFLYNLVSSTICHTNLGYDISFKSTNASSGTVTVTKAAPSYACVDADNDGYQVAGNLAGCAMVSQPDCDDNNRTINPGKKNCP